MGLLDRYLVREIGAYAALALGVFLFILMTPEVLRLSELLARENMGLGQVGQVFLSVLPGKLMWAVPLAVLAGLLLGVSRLAADSEIIALQAAGTGPARLLRPLLLFACAGAGVTLLATLWWGPQGARTIRRLQAELAAGQITYEVKPRVFDERFPHRILYVHDLDEAGGSWRGVFLADLSDPDNPKLTFARRGVAVSEPEELRLNLRLLEGSTHSYEEQSPAEYSVSTFAESLLAVPLPASQATLGVRRHADMSLGQLWEASRHGSSWRTARADFHRRLALPAACLVFGLLALPLALLTGRSGRSVGFIAAVAVAVGYYFLFLFGDRLGREGGLWPGLGVWLPNLVLLGLALFLLHKQRQGGATPWADPGSWLGEWRRALARRMAGLPSGSAPNAQGSPLAPPVATPIRQRLPRTLDLYILRGFLFHFSLLLASLLLIFALFSLLELTDEIAAHGIGWPVVARFVWYLQPQSIYWMAPLAILLALMVELALLSKRNELVAIKGAGISLYRVGIPVLLLALVASSLLFWLDYHYLPYANQRQQALRNQIKGRPPQVTLRDRHWILGEQQRIYYYRFFDRKRSLLGGVDVFEVEPESFTLVRRLHAQQASWDQQAHAWVLHHGWRRNFHDEQAIEYKPFTTSSRADLTEPPAYFQQELRESQQMNWLELHFLISELQQSGFDVTQLRVQFHKKFAFPLIGAIMVLLAFPFGPRWGHRGAVGGLAAGIALGFGYWVLMGFFESVGNLGLLPPLLAAWGPNLAFLFAGCYLFLQVDT